MRAVSLPVSPVARNRKDSTPRHGRLLHPSSWAERDDRDHAAENFFQGGSPKNRPPHFPARTSSPPEIVSDQISGDGAWMNFRFSRALPPGASKQFLNFTLPPYRGVFAMRRALCHAVSGNEGVSSALVRLDASELDHLAPLICFVGHEFSEGGRCHRHRLSSQSNQPRLHSRISKDRVDLIVELVDDRRWCVFGRAEPIPTDCVISLYE